MGALETYLSDIRDTKLSGEGVSELSYYPALRDLLEEVGGGLKPKVRCFMNLKNRGAGLPDGGLFTADQVRKPRGGKAVGTPPPTGDGLQLSLLGGQKPARGAIEVKPPSADIDVIAASEQVLGYLEAYRQVLVTNLREFLLLGLDRYGHPVTLERYRLASSEAEFWAIAAHPRRTELEQGPRFLEFLKRVLLSGATLATPQDLAWFLASYAREARVLTEAAELPALDAVRRALEDTLGVKFEGEKGEHFFRSTLVQTLFYGLFASWVMWSHDHESGDAPESADGGTFEWRQAAWTLRVPVVKALFEQIATPSRLGSLGLVPLLDLAAAALNRVDRRAFFSRFEQHHAVQYFYEPFLEAFDPELRKELGVWYTPPEIVEYMVARVDTVLREELDVPDGLADPRVYVLDPCCGTGAYLVEVLTRISQTLDEKGADALSAGEVKKAAMDRVFGFEILPAPFVIAHMQLGLLLQNMHLPLAENERVGVFLTNALTGWESPHGHQQVMALPELEAERDAAERVKQELPILVVLGNPPYNGFAGVSTAEEGELLKPYKDGLVDWGVTKHYLDDLYIRFFRVAERRVAEMGSRGVVSFISNDSWTSGPSYVTARQHLLRSFDTFWIENMHGDRTQTEYAADGRTSETIFAIHGFSPGIRQGVAISLWVKDGRSTGGPTVWFRDDLNAADAADRRQALVQSINDPNRENHYVLITPMKESKYSFRPYLVHASYGAWPSVADLASTDWLLGLNENRGNALIDADRHALVERIRIYLDERLSFEALPAAVGGLRSCWARFEPARTRAVLVSDGFDESKMLRFLARPFDLRWAYVETRAKLWNESRPSLVQHARQANRFIMARCRAPRADDGAAFYVSRSLADQHALHKDAYLIPLVLFPREQSQMDLLEASTQVQANLSTAAACYLDGIGFGPEASPQLQADAIWMHVLSVGYAPGYLRENADGVRLAWPRIPLPRFKGLLLASADLGRKVADLLDPETDVDGVTCGNLRPELRAIGLPERVDSLPLNEGAGDLAVTAGWGHGGQGGVTMPGKGKSILRPYSPEELAAIGQGAEALGLSLEQALAQLGDSAVDVYLNDVAYWRCVPSGVWSYTIGGYQVMKKWLSYREKVLLGRDLKVEEVREVTRMGRRIAAILLLQPELDANYETMKASTWSWNPE